MTPETALALRAARPAERRDVAALLAAALADDPGWAHVVPDPDERRVALGAVLGVAVRASGPLTAVALRDGRLLGAAVWQAPGRYPFGPRQRLAAVPALLPMLLRLRGRGRDVARFGTAVDAAFPPEPLRYLQALGVTPTAQGQGIGAALLTAGLALADRRGDACYLETAKAGNVAYYRRYGFELLGQAAPVHAGGPVLWRMLRPAS